MNPWLCIFCGTNPALAGSHRCEDCRPKHRQLTKRASTVRAKARRLGRQVEAISPLAIFTAAQWRCESCGTQLRYFGTARQRPIMVHRVPLYDGGHHVRDNLACWCAACLNERDRQREQANPQLAKWRDRSSPIRGVGVDWTARPTGNRLDRNLSQSQIDVLEKMT
jgi:hypothetical protein